MKKLTTLFLLALLPLMASAQSTVETIDKKSIVLFNGTYYNLNCHLEIPEDNKLQEYLSELLFCKKGSDMKTAYEAFLRKWEYADSIQTPREIIINFSKEYQLDGRFSCYRVSAYIPWDAKYNQLLLSSKYHRLEEQYIKFLKGIDREIIFDTQRHKLLGIDQIFVPAIADKMKYLFGNDPKLYAEDRCLCISSKKNDGRFIFDETTEKHFTNYFKQLVGWGQQKDLGTPRFLRGETALKKYFSDNKIDVASDDDKEADTISVSVTIGEDGSIKRTEIKKTTKYLPSRKLHAICEKMPKWLPAYQDGKLIAKETTINLGIHPNETFVEIEKPSYPGGKDALKQFLSSNIKYPVEAEEKGISGIVRVECVFNVESDGTIANVKVNKSVDPSLDAEAVRVISSMPKWIPGKRNGSITQMNTSLPVTFIFPSGSIFFASKEDTVKSRFYRGPSVIFPYGKFTIPRSQEENVEMIANYAKAHNDYKILLAGFAYEPDVYAKTQKEWENIQYKISEMRAKSVKKMLVEKYSIDADRIIAKGYGYTTELFEEVEFNRIVLFRAIPK